MDTCQFLILTLPLIMMAMVTLFTDSFSKTLFQNPFSKPFFKTLFPKSFFQNLFPKPLCICHTDVIILVNIGYFQLALRMLGLPGNNVPGSLHDCILIIVIFWECPPLALSVLGLLGSFVPGSLQGGYFSINSNYKSLFCMIF